MYKRAIHGYFILLACLMVRLACAQNSVLSAEPLPEPLPIIHGYINGMKAVAQGDMVVFFVGRQSVQMDEGCDDDLNCVMQKHRIDVVAVNKKGVLLVPQLVPQKTTKPEEETGGTDDFIFPYRTLNTLTIEPTRPQAVFISTQQSEITPAPASFTLHTGIPVVDQTSSLAFINRETMSLLVNTITTVDLLSTSGRFTERFTQVEPTSTRTASVFPTATVEAESISDLLVPSGTMPTSVEIEQGGELELRQELRQEHSTVRLQTSTDILEIRPTPTDDGTNSSSSQWTFTVRAVSNTISESSSVSQPEATPASTEAVKPESDTKTPENTENDETSSEHDVVSIQPDTDSPVSKKRRTEYPLFDGEFPELADEFPEFKGLKHDSDRRHLKDISPDYWQAFLRARTRRLVGEPFPEGVEGKDHYHGFECGVGVPKVGFGSGRANTETSEERQQWLAISKKHKEAKEAYKQNDPMYLSIEHRRDPQKRAVARENRMKYQKEINKYTRQLTEMDRKPCQRCGFLMIQQSSLDYYGNKPSWTVADGCYQCAACFPDKLLRYHYFWPDTDGPEVSGSGSHPFYCKHMFNLNLRYQMLKESSKRQVASDKNDEGEP